MTLKNSEDMLTEKQQQQPKKKNQSDQNGYIAVLSEKMLSVKSKVQTPQTGHERDYLTFLGVKVVYFVVYFVGISSHQFSYYIFPS